MAHELHLKQAFEILEQLEKMGRDRKQRTSLLTSTKENLILKKMFQLCYDWLIDWDFYYYEPDVKTFGNGNLDENWVYFLSLIEQFRNDELGFVKHSACAVEFMGRCSELEQKWYSRILNRDLSVGVSWAILNTIWEDTIPHWGPATANTIETIGAIEYPIYAEPIVGGTRAGIIIKDNSAVIYTDNFRKYPMLKFIGQGLTSKVKGGVIDGVIASPFLYYLNYKVKSITQDIMNELCNNITFIATDYFTFHAFYGAADYEDKTPFANRLEKLQQIINPKSSNIKLNSIVLVSNKRELTALYQESKHGLTLKAPSSTYINDFNNKWFIWKKQ